MKKNQPPQSLEELQELTELQLRAGAFDAASIVLRAYLDQHPGDLWVQSELCRCFLRLDEQEKASTLRKEMQENHPESAEVLALEGLQQQTQGENKRAKKTYEAALQRDPSMLWAAYNLAQISAELQDFSTAEKWFDHVLAETPENFAARYQRALLYIQTERAQEARDELTETINQNALMLQPYLLLTELHLREGTSVHAIEMLVHGLKANPLAHTLREALARVFSALNDGEAVFGVRLELCRLRGNVGDFLELGLAALQKGSDEHAAVAFTKAINLDPKDWRGYYNLAELHRAANDYEGALPLYEKALQSKPVDVVLNGFALWHLETDLPGSDPQKALVYIEEALTFNPDMPEAMYNLVLAHARLENYPAAQAALQALKERLPPHHRLYEGLSELEKASQAPTEKSSQ